MKRKPFERSKKQRKAQNKLNKTWRMKIKKDKASEGKYSEEIWIITRHRIGQIHNVNNCYGVPRSVDNFIKLMGEKK